MERLAGEGVDIQRKDRVPREKSLCRQGYVEYSVRGLSIR